MKFIRIVLSCLIVTAFSFAAQAQKTASTPADQAFEKGDYYDAINLYKKAFSKEKSKAKKSEIVFKTAECYRKVNDFKNQEIWYEKAIKAGYKEPEAILYLAQALKFNGKYDEAIVQFNNYSKEAKGDPRGEDGVKASEAAQKWKDKPARYTVENVSALNSKYSDFGAAYADKTYRKIVFTSARQESTGKGTDGGTGEKYQDIFEATVDKKNKWSAPKVFTGINTEANDGQASFDRKGTDMYFTRCENDKGKVGVCEIYFTRKLGEGWEVPAVINLTDSFTVGHPSLSADEQTLYFSSDMPGGQGGKDIWMSAYDKKNKSWGTPVNLGPKINSSEDEMYPFITADNTLYYASKGFMGMGGLDIYKSKKNGSTWDEPFNMKYPINSSADDFAFIVDESTNDRGYLSSNREGGKGGDDIYSWIQPPLIFTVTGEVYDVDTKAKLNGATVEIFGSDGSSVPFKTEADGRYKFDLKPETSYKLSASMPEYLSMNLSLTTQGMETSKDFIEYDFPLKSIKKPIELPNILYDLGKWDLRPESKVALNGLIVTMNDNPNIVIELGSHTDSRPIPMTNDTLSQRRAESVVKYLIENGIDAERLVAKGYGEKEPRTLDKDMGSFKSGDQMTDAFISKLKTTALKEQAHQLNRRTEFRVLRKDYVKSDKPGESMAPQENEKSTEGAVEEKKDEDSGSKAGSKEDDKKAEAAAAAGAAAAAAPAKAAGEIYVAEKGDTYGSVAKKYNLTLKDLKTLNGIKAEQIREGMDLKVQMDGDYSEFDAKFYTLEKGDDSWTKVSKKVSMKSADLKKLNKGVDEDSFRPGLKIRIAK